MNITILVHSLRHRQSMLHSKFEAGTQVPFTLTVLKTILRDGTVTRSKKPVWNIPRPRPQLKKLLRAQLGEQIHSIEISYFPLRETRSNTSDSDHPPVTYSRHRRVTHAWVKGACVNHAWLNMCSKCGKCIGQILRHASLYCLSTLFSSYSDRMTLKHCWLLMRKMQAQSV